jgi:hypothetical protein
MTAWPTIIGAEIARLARPETIKWPRGAKVRGDASEVDAKAGGATLVIACAPAFALDISYRTQDIIDRINRYFGYRAIAQLKVHQVPGTDANPAAPVGSAADMTAPVRTVPAAAGDLATALDALGKRIAGTKPA